MKKIKVLFIHHSTGGLLLRFGNVRKLLSQKRPDIELWDHGYNLYPWLKPGWAVPWFSFHTGLSDQDGKMTGRDFNIVISNNSPKEYKDIFTGKTTDFTLNNILKFDVIIFKNCFPTTKIETVGKLKKFKEYYSAIIDSLSKYRNQFIIFTPPPLRSEMTKRDQAKRARELYDWLTSQNQKQIHFFDFFDLLSDKTGDNANMLRRDYCHLLPVDSHPNTKANREVGKSFVDYLVGKIPTTKPSLQS